MREIVLGEVEWDGRDEYGDKTGPGGLLISAYSGFA